jgi:glycerate dehydrogenase
MNKIVVLDTVSLAQNDLSLDVIKNYGDVRYFIRTPKEKVVENIADADIVITNKVFIDKNAIDSCPTIKYITILATGTNVVDLEYARSKGIIVSNVPAYSTDSVAQMTFALILELSSKMGIHDSAVKSGDWVKNPDFCFCLAPLIELKNKVLGIVGYGNIGKAVAKIAEAFGMKVLIHNRTPFNGSVTLEEIYKNSDFITLHCPLTEKNANMINADSIGLMKNNAIVINTARGGLVDEKALADALNSGRILGAGVDVLSSEPPLKSNPLLSAKNCVILPHIAWATIEARTRLLEVTCKNIESYLSNNPINVVN